MTNHANSPVLQGGAGVGDSATDAAEMTPRERWRTREGTAASLLAVGLTLVDLILLQVFLLITGMSSDGCAGDTSCESAELAHLAGTVACGLLGVSLVVAYVGMFVAARTNRSLTVWPFAGLAVTGLAVLVMVVG